MNDCLRFVYHSVNYEKITFENYSISGEQGDTLEKIARKENISITELQAANPTLSATRELEKEANYISTKYVKLLMQHDVLSVFKKINNILALDWCREIRMIVQQVNWLRQPE